jgi:hypothetical protein
LLTPVAAYKVAAIPISTTPVPMVFFIFNYPFSVLCIYTYSGTTAAWSDTPLSLMVME